MLGSGVACMGQSLASAYGSYQDSTSAYVGTYLQPSMMQSASFLELYFLNSWTVYLVRDLESSVNYLAKSSARREPVSAGGHCSKLSLSVEAHLYVLNSWIG